MTEENNVDPLQKYAEKLEQIVGSIGDIKSEVKGLANKTEAVSDTVRTIKEKTEMPSNDDDANEYAALEPEPIEKKIEKTVTKTIEKILGQRDVQSNYERECAQYDQKASQEFPDLKDKQSSFYRETMEELRFISPIGKKVNGDPILPADAVYNAASRAWTKMAREGRITPEQFVPQESMRFNTSPKPRGGELTEERKFWAQRAGFDEKTAKEIYAKYDREVIQEEEMQKRVRGY